MANNKKRLRVTMPDSSVWLVPVMVIAWNRANHFAGEYGNSTERSLNEDTLLLFKECLHEIINWAAGNMDWTDVSDVAVQIAGITVDYQDGWVNGKKEIV